MKNTLTQKKIADTLDISGGHLSDILRGRRCISRRLAEKIKRKTGLPFDFSLEKPPKEVFLAVRATLLQGDTK